MTQFDGLREAIIEGDVETAGVLVTELLGQGVLPLEIIDLGLVSGMNFVGERFRDGDMYIPEVLMAARAVSVGMEKVKPFISKEDVKPKGTVIIATVRGDLHEIGKNLVAMILETGGFDVVNLGVDISPDAFVDATKKYQPQFVCMSSLLTTTMMAMKETIDLLEEEGLRDRVKVLVGGAPISKEFAASIGADGYGADAIETKELCMQMISN